MSARCGVARAQTWSLVGLLAAVSLQACSLVELSGRLTRQTGQAMTDYSRTDDGLVGKAAGFGGRVNTAVGTAVEDVAQKGRADAPSPVAGPQPVAVDREGLSPVGSSVSMHASNGADMSLAEAQRALTKLGYQPGPADGVMGRRTYDALSKFQKDKGMAASGTLDRETIEALRRGTRDH